MLSESEFKRSFEDAIQLVQLFVPGCLQQKLRINGKESSVLLAEIKLDIHASIKQLEDEVIGVFEEFMKLEVQTFKHILEVLSTEDNWDIYKTPENFQKHSNLVNLLNAMILIQVKKNVGFDTILTRIFGLFFKYQIPAFDELQAIVTRKKDDYFDADESETDNDSPQFKRRYISMFDYFFKNSILGNIHQNLFAIDNYIPSYLTDLGLKKDSLQLLMKTIQFVNNFGPVLSREKVKVDKSKVTNDVIEINFNESASKQITLYTPKILKISKIDFPNLMMIFKVNPIASSHRNPKDDLENGSLELIAKIDNANLKKFENFKLAAGCYKLVCLPGYNEISCELTTESQEWRNRLTFVNLATLALGQIIN
jgi:hypothetical protein